MEDIFMILKDAGIEVPDDKISDIQKEVAKEYKTISEFNIRGEQKDTRISELEKQNNDYAEQIKKFSGSEEDLASLRNKVSEFEAADEMRKNEETAAAELNALKTRFSVLNGENKYLNEGTENWMFGEFQKALSDDANKGKSDADIYTEITKDKNVFVNPQEKKIIPPAGCGSGVGGDKGLPKLF